MPLSEEEQRLLEQMEQALAAEDPKFASALRGSAMRARSRRQAILAAIGFIAGVALLMTGAVTTVTAVAVVGFVVMLGCAYAFVVLWRRSQSTSSEAPTSAAGLGTRRSPHAPRSAGPSFMDRMEERWRRRHDDE